MTASVDVQPFRFETSYNTRDVRPERQAAQRSKFGVTDDQLFVVFGLGSIACLFWRYTFALGAVGLALTTFLWAMRERSRVRRKEYESLEEPPTNIHITLTDAGYSLKGDNFFAETAWSSVINAFEMNEYLLVQSWRMPRLYLPMLELKRAGVYDRVRAIVDSQSAKRAAAMAAIKARRA